MTESAEKKFSPHMVASFNASQLIAVASWVHNNVKQTELSFNENFLMAIQTAELDEKGKKMDENAKKRLGYGVKVLGTLLLRKEHIHGLQGAVQVWQTTPNEKKIELRWNFLRLAKSQA